MTKEASKTLLLAVARKLGFKPGERGLQVAVAEYAGLSKTAVSLALSDHHPYGLGDKNYDKLVRAKRRLAKRSKPIPKRHPKSRWS